MPFQDSPEGTTHHDKDACYKCEKCNTHFFIRSELGLCVDCIIELTTKSVAEQVKHVLNKLK